METRHFASVSALLRANEQPERYAAAMAQSAKDQNIASIWLFSECSAKEIRSISSVADAVTVPAGRTLVKEGTVGRELYLIVSGTASVQRNGRQVATLSAGQHFGELSLLDRRPRNATVVSKTDMELFVIGQRQFNGLLDTIPTLSRKLISAMANRMREQDAKAVH
jgi:CRP/FNR family transcriptional regulator, cyclic AMP receptor protein